MSDPGDLESGTLPNFVLSPKQPSAGSSEAGDDSDLECEDTDKHSATQNAEIGGETESVHEGSIAMDFNGTSEFNVTENSQGEAHKALDSIDQRLLDNSLRNLRNGQVTLRAENEEDGIEVKGLDNDRHEGGEDQFVKENRVGISNNDCPSEGSDDVDQNGHHRNSYHSDNDKAAEDEDNDDDEELYLNNNGDQIDDNFDSRPEDENRSPGDSSDHDDGNDRAEDEVEQLDAVEVVSQSENAEADQHLEMESAESDQLHHHGYPEAVAGEQQQQRDEPEGQQEDVNLPGAQGHPGQHDRHEPVRQWVLNIDPNPHPEDDQMFDLSFSSDQGERSVAGAMGPLLGSASSVRQRLGLSNSNPDLRDDSRREIQGKTQGLGTSHNRGRYEGQNIGQYQEDRFSPNNGNIGREETAREENGFNHRTEDSNLEQDLNIESSNTRIYEHSHAELTSSGNIRQTDGENVLEHLNSNNTEPSNSRGVMFPIDSLGISNLDTETDDSHLLRHAMHSRIGGSQALKKEERVKRSEYPGGSELPSNTSSLKQKVNRHEHCTVSGSVKSSHGAVPKQRASSLPRPQREVLNRGTQKLRTPVSGQNSSLSSKSTSGQWSGRKDEAKRVTQRSGGGGQRSTAANQRSGGSNVRGRQNQDRRAEAQGVPSMKKHLASQGIDISPIRDEDLNAKPSGKGAGPQNSAVNQPKLNASSGSSSNIESVQRDISLPGQPAQQQGVDTRQRLLHGQSLQESTHLSDGNSEAMDYIAGVQQHLQAILQDGNQLSSPHGNQLSRYGNHLGSFGNQLGGHSNQQIDTGNNLGGYINQFSSLGNQQSAHGNQPSGHGNQQISHGNQPSGHGNQLISHGNQPSGHGNQQNLQGNQPSGYVNQPSGHRNQPSGHGNQPSGHGNQPNGRGYQSQMGGHVTSHMGGQNNSSPVTGHSFYSEGVSGNLDQLLSFSSKYLTDLPPSQQAHGPLEMHLLREALEKEQYRRKHCEQLIQELQRKMLESQEQLAVAMEVDRKKDNMIKQLDKSLGSVVDKWKQSESERQHKMEVLQTEHEELKKVHQMQTQTLSKFEAELQDTVERLSEEKIKSQQTDREQQDQLRLKTQELHACAEELALHRGRSDTLTNECSGLSERLDRLHIQFAQLKEVYDEESLSWEQKERHFKEELDTLKHRQQEEMEKVKKELFSTHEIVAKKDEELAESMKLNREFEVEVDTALREKESLKVQLGLQEARLESAQRRLEAELAQKYQKQIQEEVAAVKAEMVSMETQLQDKHRHQIEDLGQRNKQELSGQMSALRGELDTRESRYREQEGALRQTISELQSELEDQREANRLLESQHNELASKLPAMMQAHCDQALRLLQRGNGGPTNDQRHVIGSSNPSVTMTTSSITFSTGSMLTSAAQFPSDVSGSRSLIGPEVMSRAVVGQADDHRLNAGQLSTVQDVANSSLFSLEDQALGSNTNSPQRNSRIGDGNSLREPRGIPVGSVLPSNTMTTASHGNFSYSNASSVSHSNNMDGLQSSLATSYYGNASGLPSNPVLASANNRSGYTNNVPGVAYDLNDNSLHSNSSSLPPQPAGLQLRPVKYERDKREATNTSSVVSFRDGSGERSVVYETGKGARLVPTSEASDQRDSLVPAEVTTSSQVTPSTLFQNLSAQNHQGMEFIRRQLEQQTAQILLHPPASMDLSGLQSAGLEETGQSASHSGSNASHHGSNTSHPGSNTSHPGSNTSHPGSNTSHPGSNASGSKVTWREGEDSFLSPHSEKISMDYSGMGEKFDQHETRQHELQRYIKMLLHKPPGGSADTSMVSEQTPHTEGPHTGTEQPFTGRTQDGPPVGIDQIQSVRQNEGLNFESHQDENIKQTGAPPPFSLSQVGGSSNLSLGEANEISRLLGMYRQTDEGDAKDMQDVMSYLRETHDNRFEQPVQPSLTPPHLSPSQAEYPPSPRKQPSKARKNLEGTYNVTHAKQNDALPGLPGFLHKPRQSNVPALDPQGSNKPAQSMAHQGSNKAAGHSLNPQGPNVAVSHSVVPQGQNKAPGHTLDPQGPNKAPGHSLDPQGPNKSNHPPVTHIQAVKPMSQPQQQQQPLLSAKQGGETTSQINNRQQQPAKGSQKSGSSKQGSATTTTPRAESAGRGGGQAGGRGAQRLPGGQGGVGRGAGAGGQQKKGSVRKGVWK